MKQATNRAGSVIARNSNDLRESEQPADMWCEAGAPPPLKPWKELLISKGSLNSRTGQLLLSPAHMKDC
jgi:hypothetical protein